MANAPEGDMAVCRWHGYGPPPGMAPSGFGGCCMDVGKWVARGFPSGRMDAPDVIGASQRTVYV